MISKKNSRLNALGNLCRQHRVTSLYSFGSRAAEATEWVRVEREEFDETESDLDLAITLERETELSARERVRLTIDLERFFNVPRVDLVLLWDADAFLAVDVIRGDLLYCNDPDQQSLDELYVLRRAGDLAYFEEQRLSGILSGELRR
jgi:predicted nucleotidyltransferase